jgi:hypothetical protein
MLKESDVLSVAWRWIAMVREFSVFMLEFQSICLKNSGDSTPPRKPIKMNNLSKMYFC